MTTILVLPISINHQMETWQHWRKQRLTLRHCDFLSCSSSLPFTISSPLSTPPSLPRFPGCWANTMFSLQDHKTYPSSASPTHTHSSPPTLCSLSQSLLCCWVGLKGKENWLTHRLFIDHPFFLPLSLFFFGFLCSDQSIYTVSKSSQRRVQDGDLVWLTLRGVVKRRGGNG